MDHPPFRYRDRRHAGQILGELILEMGNAPDVVLGIPRGGMIVAAEVSDRLNCPLQSLVVRKIGAPMHPELAIGAVSPGGALYLDHALIEHLKISQQVLTNLISDQQHLARDRARYFGDPDASARLTGKRIALVDDGLATGSTMALAIQVARTMDPEHILIAIPVGSIPATHVIRRLADTVICPLTPPDFHAVGQYYEDFTEVTDAEVIQALHPA
jgi:predicted phosphoribosyltransferase